MRLFDEVIVVLFARLYSIITKHSFILTSVRLYNYNIYQNKNIVELMWKTDIGDFNFWT